jgi:oxygen-independent coproporphyrinogen-3 oxidase
MSLNHQEILDYNVAAPRYTSYPPANLFKECDSPSTFEEFIVESNQSGTEALSFYIHIPFCPHRCLFCGCQTEIGVGATEKERYFKNLFIEMDTVLPLIDKNRKITQIHFGGGTPNSVPFKYLNGVLDRLRSRFELAEGAELAIECDPFLLSKKKVEELGKMGFNRISIGIQDLNKEVLDTVERKDTRIPLGELVELCRENGMKSVNLDLIYGLPKQDLISFNSTVKKVLEIGPDRVATFAYAHVPWFKGQQNKLKVEEMASAIERLKIHEDTVNLFTDAGYEWIGMDHFALPSDSLSKAAKAGSLKRNFQGYCTKEHTGQVIAFGASSIGQLDNGYYQNIKTAVEYSEAIEKQKWAPLKLYKLSTEEKYIAQVIENIMCNGELKWADLIELEDSTEQIEERCNDELAQLEQEGLIESRDWGFMLTSKGRWVSRYVVMKLDPLFQSGKNNKMYSQSV